MKKKLKIKNKVPWSLQWKKLDEVQDYLHKYNFSQFL